jgi:hypothetical protein
MGKFFGDDPTQGVQAPLALVFDKLGRVIHFLGNFLVGILVQKEKLQHAAARFGKFSDRSKGGGVVFFLLLKFCPGSDIIVGTNLFVQQGTNRRMFFCGFSQRK